MKDKEFIRAIQSRTARVAVSASSVRGAGGKGVVRAARDFLRQLDLSRFAVRDPNAFSNELDRATKELRSALPRGAQHWGVARKVLNIFLRDCCYTSYLASRFRLDGAAPLMELPLDSITAKKLKSTVGRGGLPPWSGVKHVTPELNARFQTVAATEAAKHKTDRFHLDAIWWSVDRDENDAT
ncbi:MAG TPA: hypothetical protein VE969_04070 [Pyrinomonadaceae bacterium]|nr:hypothetical protein [Pyrinomonadaceae bacterium]